MKFLCARYVEGHSSSTGRQLQNRQSWTASAQRRLQSPWPFPAGLSRRLMKTQPLLGARDVSPSLCVYTLDLLDEAWLRQTLLCDLTARSVQILIAVNNTVYTGDHHLPVDKEPGVCQPILPVTALGPRTAQRWTEQMQRRNKCLLCFACHPQISCVGNVVPRAAGWRGEAFVSDYIHPEIQRLPTQQELSGPSSLCLPVHRPLSWCSRTSSPDGEQMPVLCS